MGREGPGLWIFERASLLEGNQQRRQIGPDGTYYTYIRMMHTEHELSRPTHGWEVDGFTLRRRAGINT